MYTVMLAAFRFATLVFVVSACAPALTVRYISKPVVKLGLSGFDVARPRGALEVSNALQRSLQTRLSAANEAAAGGVACTQSQDCWQARGEIQSVVLRYDTNLANPKSANAQLDVEVQVIRRDAQTSLVRVYSADATGMNVTAQDGPRRLLDRVTDQIAEKIFADIAPRINFDRIEFDDQSQFEPGIKQAVNGNLVGAENFFNDLLRQNNQLAGAYYNLGVIAEARGDYSQAGQLYQSARSISAKSLYDETYQDFLRRQAATR